MSHSLLERPSLQSETRGWVWERVGIGGRTRRQELLGAPSTEKVTESGNWLHGEGINNENRPAMQEPFKPHFGYKSFPAAISAR